MELGFLIIFTRWLSEVGPLMSLSELVRWTPIFQDMIAISLMS